MSEEGGGGSSDNDGDNDGDNDSDNDSDNEIIVTAMKAREIFADV